MQLVYALIYYFQILLLILILSLAIFLIPLARKLLVKFMKQYGTIFDSQIVYYTKLLVFGIIALILIESLFTYTLLNRHFSNRSRHIERQLGDIQNIDLVIPKSNNKQGYLMALKQYREFYLSERNIMLTVSAIFMFFVFQRLLYCIRKYAETEQAILAIETGKKDA